MKSVLLRCRDAELLGPFCDYVTDVESDEEFEEEIQKMQLNSRIFNEPEIHDEEVEWLRKTVRGKS
jgi:hypothetical protein